MKFAKADTAKESYTTGTTVTIGKLFKAAEFDDQKLKIQSDKVQVFVSSVGDVSSAGAIYAADADNWLKGTLSFSGICRSCLETDGKIQKSVDFSIQLWYHAFEYGF